MQVVHVRLFGPLEVMIDGVLLALPTRKLAALLGYLALEGETSRAKLAALFWNTDDDRAKANLRNELYRLKRTPLTNTILEHQGVLRLGGVVSDLQTWREHETQQDWHAMLQLERGVLFEGTQPEEAEGFDEWLQLARAHWTEAFNQVRLQHAKTLESNGEHQAALREHRLLLERDFFREDSQRAVMRLCVALGQPAKAAEQYQRYANFLRAELGVEPSPHTQALLKDLKNLSGAQAPEGFEREWVQIETAYREAKFVFLTGPNDDAKTRLFSAFIESKGFRMGLLEGQSQDLGVPFATLRGLLRRLLTFRPANAWDAETQKVLAHALSDQQPKQSPTSKEQQWLFDGLTTFVFKMMPANFARVASKAHLFDDESLEFILLENAQARKHDPQSLCLGTLEWDALGSRKKALLEQFMHEGLLATVEVSDPTA